MSSLYQHSCKVATVKGWAMYRQIPSSVKRLTDWLRCQYMAAKLSGFRPGRLGDCSDINKARPATRIGGDQMEFRKIQVYGADCGVPPGAKMHGKGPGATSQTNGAAEQADAQYWYGAQKAVLCRAFVEKKWLHDEAIRCPALTHTKSLGEMTEMKPFAGSILWWNPARRVLLGEGRISQSERFLNRAATSHWQYAAFPR